MQTDLEILPWCLIIPRLECNIRREAALNLLQVFERFVFQDDFCMIDYCENGIFHARTMARLIAPHLTEAYGTPGAANVVKSRIDTRHTAGKNVWRLYMYLAGCCLTDPKTITHHMPHPSSLWSMRVNGEMAGWSSWTNECLIQSGFEGHVTHPQDDSVIWSSSTYC